MLHRTLNTGQIVEHPAVEESAVELLRPLVATGGGPLPHGAYHVEINRRNGGAVFTISSSKEPIVTCGVAWTAAGVAGGA
jgi:hypothetical protein